MIPRKLSLLLFEGDSEGLGGCKQIEGNSAPSNQSAKWVVLARDLPKMNRSSVNSGLLTASWRDQFTMICELISFTVIGFAYLCNFVAMYLRMRAKMEGRYSNRNISGSIYLLDQRVFIANLGCRRSLLCWYLLLLFVSKCGHKTILITPFSFSYAVPDTMLFSSIDSGDRLTVT